MVASMLTHSSPLKQKWRWLDAASNSHRRATGTEIPSAVTAKPCPAEPLAIGAGRSGASQGTRPEPATGKRLGESSASHITGNSRPCPQLSRRYPIHIWFLNTNRCNQGFLINPAKLALKSLTVSRILCHFQCSTKENGKLLFSIRRHHATLQRPIEHHPRALSYATLQSVLVEEDYN